jgi:hypothetical protein
MRTIVSIPPGVDTLTIIQCDHDWLYSPTEICTYPPMQEKICRKCGFIVTETEEVETESFESVHKKFYGEKQ